MKLSMKVAAISLCLLMAAASARAQDQPKASDDHSTDITHLRLDILLTEYDGDKKVTSLPNTMFLEARPHNAQDRQLRMGLRVPIASNSGTNQQFSYENVGTDIDARATTMADGSYDLDLRVDRSSVYSANQGKDETERVPAAGGLPIMRNFVASFDLGLHDGQTSEGTSTTDPFNGHVLKITVILHVLK
jgi:opacity protein-like surface antigen